MTIQIVIQRLISSLQGLIGAIIILLVAMVSAWFLKKMTMKGLRHVELSEKLQRWNLAKNEEESQQFIDTIATLIYFVTILLFLPLILKGLNLSREIDPIVMLLQRFLDFLPNMIASGLILTIGSFLCRFIKTLTQNLFAGINVDRWYRKALGQSTQEEVAETRLAEALSSIIYILIFIPILTTALRILGIPSISNPIISMMEQILSLIPNVLIALMLIMIGNFIANLVSDLVESMLKTSGIDKYSPYLNFKGESNVLISNLIGQLLKIVMMIFFFVEALDVLQLEVLNRIGISIIGYVPFVVSALVILTVGTVIANVSSVFLAKLSGSKLFAEVVRYGIIIFAVFMTLDQLQFAQTIVNTSFTIILGAFAVAFSLSFGLGGKDFAAKQLEKVEEILKQDSQESDIEK